MEGHGQAMEVCHLAPLPGLRPCLGALEWVKTNCLLLVHGKTIALKWLY